MSRDPALDPPVAIVGIGCRLPGGADDPASLWTLLCDEQDAITPLPEDRFARDLYDARPATPGRIMSRWGGFVDGLDGFDAAFFETSPREAERLDPQQRLVLETSCEALDDAGIARSALAGSSAGVFVGLWLNEYEARMFADTDAIDFHMTTGTGRYAASGRLSYFLDLLGPSVTIDTACSSSLVAIHLACEALGRGECDVALAGGANAIIEPFITVAYSQSKMMAPDGHCKFGDAAANGYVRSDGAVMLSLKRLDDAVADGDRVYAVIKGSAVTNDGRSSGFLATPGEAGQENMLRRAYDRAGVDPSSVQYVEAHGTGTAAGDPVEVRALGSVVGGADRSDPCLVGSIKSNIGHTEGAAGAAGLAKLALALHHGEIPASLHVEEPNPGIAWDELGMRVNATRRPWPTVDGPRRGGVSAFGIAGTNAHAVLEEAPAPAPTSTPSSPLPAGDVTTATVLAISAADRSALRSLGASYAEILGAGTVPVGELCAAAATQRDHLAERIAVVGFDAAELERSLGERIAQAEARPEDRSGAGRRVAFVFSGQGSQWAGMHQELLATEAVFADAMAACDRAIAAEAGWSVLEMLTSSGPLASAEDIDVVQPTLFAVQVSLAALWRSWGITPAAVIGHSLGEVAAAHVAGILDLNDAAKVICRRSKLLRTIAGQGAMALVDLSVEDANEAISGRTSTLSIAVSNGPRSTVISGDPTDLRAVLDTLTERDVFCRPVKVDVASHSPQVDQLLDELRAQLAGIEPRSTEILFRSTALGARIDGVDLDGDYWASNLRNPVMFGDAVAELAAESATAFVELSPHPILVPSIEQVLDNGGLALASTRREQPERSAMLASLANLYEHGAEIDWPAVTGETTKRALLPAYPWQRDRHWLERPNASVERAGGHQLLGHDLHPATDPGTVVWQHRLDDPEFGFLANHVVQGTPVVPATGLAELIRASAARSATDDAVALDRLTLHEALVLDPNRPGEIQVVSTPTECRVYGRAADDTVSGAQDDPADWRLHAEAAIAVADLGEQGFDIEAIKERCEVRHDAAAHRAAMLARRLTYDGTFRSVAGVWIGDGEALGQIEPQGPGETRSARRIAAMDGCLQVALAALPAATASTTFVPVDAGRLEFGASEDAAWSHAVITGETSDSFVVDVTVIDDGGHAVATCRDLRFRRIGSRDLTLGRLLYEVEWMPAEPAAPTEATGTPSDPTTNASWIVYSDESVLDDVAARLADHGGRCLTVRAGGEFEQRSDDEFVIRPTSMSDHERVLAEATSDGTPCAGILYGWATGIGPDDVDQAERLGYHAPVALLQAMADVAEAPRLWLTTRGAFGAAPAQAVLWGLGRSAANEFPSNAVTLVDLDDLDTGSREQRLLDEILAAGAEQQISYAGGARRVARLRAAPLPTRTRVHAEPVDSWRVATTAPGALDSLRLVGRERRSPEPDEVEVRVDNAALNFLDVLKAMDICPGIESSPAVALGAECAGVVSAVGDGVEHVAVGDEVVAITSSYRTTSLLTSHATLPSALVRPRPPGSGPAEMSTIPVAYVTAYYSLGELARVRRGETVLVHSAAGGVGLAAIELCRHLGAEVIATAGSEAKRSHLRELGVPHVFDSRSTDFVSDVDSVTSGRGVDVVLNSLVGDAIPAGFATLAPGGRFVEIGKRDVFAHSRVDLALFKNNISLFVVDLADLTERDPVAVGRLFAEVMELVASGALPALPFTRTPIQDVPDAFRTMARAEHIGKLVLDVPAEPVLADLPAVRDDATYVISGGHGGLGLAIAEHLVDRGARHLALLGRSAPGVDAKRSIAAMTDRGAEVGSVAADVADEASLAAALDGIRTTMPPVRGVIHAAGLLADATIATMDADRASAALAPKLHGSWNLHRATLDDPLDHFILFSSVAGILGLAGQSNYAAGNAALDALATHRRGLGRPARSIQWGPWAQIGLAASDERGGRLDDRGLSSLDPTEAIGVFDLLLDADDHDLAVMDLDAAAWAAGQPIGASLLEALATPDPATSPAVASLADRLRALPAGHRRRRAMEETLRDELAAVLRVAPSRIQRDVPMKSMGLDSLMALELRNRLEALTGLTLSGTVVWSYPTLALLGEHLSDDLAVPLAAEPDAPTSDGPTSETIEPDGSMALDDATVPAGADPSLAETVADDDLEAMLAAELAAVDALLDNDGGAA